MRKTKIICTIGPSTTSFEILKNLYDAGLDVVRLNMSHGDQSAHEEVIKIVRTLSRGVDRPVSIMIDTQGPEIRTGNLCNDLDLKDGDVISISAIVVGDVEKTSVHINYEYLIQDVDIGDRISVDNGIINLEVLSKKEHVMWCRVIDGGVLKSRRHVNFPGIHVNLPAITEKDKRDIAFAIKQEVDFIALSFVREAKDIHQARELLGSDANKIKIIAKIENQEGVRNIKEIVNEVDGVMVARGDLGVEVQLHELPNIQRIIVQLCANKGKRVIVATHLLESMIKNPIPTRAEVTDVANAVYEEVDAVMLSCETAVGRYPVKCVQYLDSISRSAEDIRGLQFTRELVRDSDKQHVAAAAELVDSLNAKGIVVITRAGLMANYVTNCHPKATILAFTSDERTQRQLALNRNLCCYLIKLSNDPERNIANAFSILLENREYTLGDKVVVVSDILNGADVNAIQIRMLGEFIACS